MPRNGSDLSSGGQGRHPRKTLGCTVKDTRELLGCWEVRRGKRQEITGERDNEKSQRTKGNEAEEGNSGGKTRKQQCYEVTV